jgi:hypothetical protein
MKSVDRWIVSDGEDATLGQMGLEITKLHPLHIHKMLDENYWISLLDGKKTHLHSIDWCVKP